MTLFKQYKATISDKTLTWDFKKPKPDLYLDNEMWIEYKIDLTENIDLDRPFTDAGNNFLVNKKINTIVMIKITIPKILIVSGVFPKK